MMNPRDLNRALIDGVKRNDSNAVLSVVRFGANVNVQDEDGDTPLHLAARNGNKEIIFFLISENADLSIKNNHLQQPSDCIIDETLKNYLAYKKGQRENTLETPMVKNENYSDFAISDAQSEQMETTPLNPNIISNRNEAFSQMPSRKRKESGVTGSHKIKEMRTEPFINNQNSFPLMPVSDSLVDGNIFVGFNRSTQISNPQVFNQYAQDQVIQSSSESASLNQLGSSLTEQNLSADTDQIFEYPLTYSVEPATKKKVVSTYSTKPDGNCAFHALLGEWDEKQEYYFCGEASTFRQMLSDKIKSYKFNAVNINSDEQSIKESIEQAIQNLICDNELMNGEEIEQARKKYQNTLEKDIQKIHLMKNILWEKIKVYPEIHDRVDNFANRSGKEIDDAEKIFYFLNNNRKEESWLLGMISSSLTLIKLFDGIKELTNRKYNWSEVYSNQGIINEYAAFISKNNSYIEPHEINIMAYLFNKKVIFYTGNAKPIITNSACQDVVTIHYNGGNHFERGNDIHPLLHVVQQENATVPATAAIKNNNLINFKTRQLENIYDDTVQINEFNLSSLNYLEYIKKFTSSTEQGVYNPILIMERENEEFKFFKNQILIKETALIEALYRFIDTIKLSSQEEIFFSDFKNPKIIDNFIDKKYVEFIESLKIKNISYDENSLQAEQAIKKVFYQHTARLSVDFMLQKDNFLYSFIPLKKPHDLELSLINYSDYSSGRSLK